MPFAMTAASDHPDRPCTIPGRIRTGITTCGPGVATPCATNALPLPQGVFVAGVATDAVNNLVYASSSAGGSPATIFRYNVATNTTSAYVANNSATVPNVGANFPCSLT